jgi:hypothetical protein
MPASRQCVCTICSLERELETNLAAPYARLAYAALRANFPVLAPFPTALSVLAHMRRMRHTNGSGEVSDRIFRALRDGLEDSLPFSFGKGRRTPGRQGLCGVYVLCAVSAVARYALDSLECDRCEER